MYYSVFQIGQYTMLFDDKNHLFCRKKAANGGEEVDREPLGCLLVFLYACTAKSTGPCEAVFCCVIYVVVVANWHWAGIKFAVLQCR